jgi:hypothetical protein
MQLVLSVMSLGVLAASGASAGTKKNGAGRSSNDPSTMGKIAVFDFDGDEATSVRKHVIMALSGRGLEIDTSLRPVQTADEFRDMGAMLNLAAYVHGQIKVHSPERATATIVVRSGVTGRPLLTTTIPGHPRGIRFDVEEKLWERVGKAVLRACKEATKPRRPRTAPMHIEAGTPLP